LRPTKKSSEVINVLTKKGLKEGIQKAKKTILSTGLVAFPTESFYGLAVNSLDERAIKLLFKAKKRKIDQPILLLIPSIESLEQYVQNIPEVAYKLIERFWPGGLTLIFQAAPNISPLLTAGTGKIGVRLSSHPVADALVKAVGIPITGTSANISGQPPCSSADEVLESIGQSVDLILDGGATKGKVGSTLMDVTSDPPVILRQGMIVIPERLDEMR
jgi:L-threonylcarbamoyladenylate synthase